MRVLAVTLATLLLLTADALAEAVPGMKFADCSECPEMVWIPPGEFTMGSRPDEPGRYDDGPNSGDTIPN